jgi:hypothetical protein
VRGTVRLVGRLAGQPFDESALSNGIAAGGQARSAGRLEPDQRLR